MKAFKLPGILGLLALFSILSPAAAQERNFLDRPYLETNSRIDSLVVPDKIYLGIEIREADTKGRTSVEELENRMAEKLKALGIDLDKQLTLSDLASNFRDYFLRKTDVQKSKSYTLLVYDGLTAGKVIQALESIGISNIQLQRTEYSKIESLKIALRQKALEKARKQAAAMIETLGQTLGKALYISDLSTDYQQVHGQISGIQVRGFAMEKADAPLDVAFEKIPVEASVNVKFAIE